MSASIDVEYCLSGILQENGTPIPLSTYTNKIKCNNTTNSPNIANSNCAVMISNHCIDGNCYETIPTCGVLKPDSNGQCPTNFTYMNDYFGCIKQTYLGYQTTSQPYSQNTKVSFDSDPQIGYYFPYGGTDGQTCKPYANSIVQCYNANDIIPSPKKGYFKGVNYKTCNNGGRQYSTAYFRNSSTDFYWKYPNSCPCNASNGNPDDNMCISGFCAQGQDNKYVCSSNTVIY